MISECSPLVCEWIDLVLTCCPIDHIGADWHWINDTIEMAGLYRKGLSQVHGGVLDQAQSFISVCEIIFELEDYWKAKLGIF